MPGGGGLFEGGGTFADPGGMKKPSGVSERQKKKVSTVDTSKL
jgi:hypothetical protein